MAKNKWVLTTLFAFLLALSGYANNRGIVKKPAFKNLAIDKNAVLPPVEIKAGKARLEGQILNYRVGMSDRVEVGVEYPFCSQGLNFMVDEKGRFSCEIDAFSVQPVNVRWMKYHVQCFIAPGETTSIIFNHAEKSKRKSRSNNNKTLGEKVYYGGYLASLSKELADIRSRFSLKYDNYDSLKTPETLKAFLLEKYQDKKAEVEAYDISPACKQILHCSTDLYYASCILSITSLIDNDYIRNNQLRRNYDAMRKYYATRKFDLPDDFYDVLKDFTLLNDPRILYTQEVTRLLGRREDYSKILGTDQGMLFDLIKVGKVFNEIIPYEGEVQLEQVPASFQEFIRMREEFIQSHGGKIKRTGVNEYHFDADEGIFPYILFHFREMPILINFWETSCEPCQNANEDMKLVKAELADKDIVYVYITDESSSWETWQNIICNLPGEHFRLSEKQWNYLKETLAIDSVPTYLFIDRQGNIREKQAGFSDVRQMKERLLKLLEE